MTTGTTVNFLPWWGILGAILVLTLVIRILFFVVDKFEEEVEANAEYCEEIGGCQTWN